MAYHLLNIRTSIFVIYKKIDEYQIVILKGVLIKCREWCNYRINCIAYELLNGFVKEKMGIQL